MSLALTRKSGEDFYVGDVRFIVREIFADNQFELGVEGEDDCWVITDEQAVEVMQNVFVSAGNDVQLSTVRVVIDAPADIVILRGEIYDRRLENERLS